MALQNAYTKSIRPKSISNLRSVDGFVEFMDYFERDCKEFISSCGQLDDFLNHFMRIGKELISKGLLKSLRTRIDFHSTLTKYKISPLEDYLNQFWGNYLQENDEVFRKVTNELGRAVSLPPSEEELSSLSDEEQALVTQACQELQMNYIRFIVIIGAFVNQLFFAFEAECKILCSLGCFPFSLLYAKNEIFSHNDIWKALKRLGKISQRGVTCQICRIGDSCDFSINFEALANIYCYAIKVRMLSDYEDLFYNYRESWEKMKVYFDMVKEVVASQMEITNKCLEVRF